MKRHNPDLVSLVFGLVFLLVAALWPLWRLSVLDDDSITWVPATALIAIGLLGLTLSIARSRAPAPDSVLNFDEPAYVPAAPYDTETTYDTGSTYDARTTYDAGTAYDSGTTYDSGTASSAPADDVAGSDVDRASGRSAGDNEDTAHLR